jgi:hypothetical protein
MKKLFLLCFVLFSFSTLAYEEIWKLGDHFIPMEKNEEKDLLISKSCSTRPCDAMNILHKVTMKNIDAEKLIGGKNPGAVLCTEKTKGRILYMKDLSGNENTFCFFKDKSMVSTGTLSLHAAKNDKVKKK